MTNYEQMHERDRCRGCGKVVPGSYGECDKCFPVTLKLSGKTVTIPLKREPIPEAPDND